MHVLGEHVHAAHVVEEAVVALADDRHDGVVGPAGSRRWSIIQRTVAS